MESTPFPVIHPQKKQANLIIRIEMNDQSKTKAQLISELDALRKELETFKIENVETNQSQKSSRYVWKDFSHILSHSPIGFFVYDKNGTVSECNKAILEMFDLSRDEIIGNNIKNSLKVEEVGNAITSSLSGKQIHYESEYKTASDGKAAYLKGYSSPIMNDSGEIIGGIGIVEDNTERKKAEVALLESEERYRNLFEKSPEAIILLGMDGIILDYNHEISLTGFQRDELIGKHFSELALFGDYKNRAEQILHGNNEPFELEVETLKGDTLYLYVHSTILSEGGQKFIRFMVRDITESKSAENALRESVRKYHLLFNSGNDAVFVHQPTIGGTVDNFIEVNDIACERLGYSREELLKKNINDIAVPGAFDTKHVLKTLFEKKKLMFESVHITKKGKQIPVEINAHLFEFNQKPTVLSIVRDITDRKQVEKTLNFRLELEKIESDISTSFINAERGTLDEVMTSALERIARFANANRSSLFILSEDLVKVTNTHEWCENDEDSQIKLLRDIPFSEFGWHREELLKKNTIIISKREDYPPEAEQEREWVQKHGFRSMLFIPLIKHNQLHGALGFYGPIEQEIDFPSEFIDVLQPLGNMILNVLERKLIEESLQKSEKIYRSMIANISDVIAIMGVDGIIKYKSPNIEKLFGWRPEDLEGSEGWKTVHPDDLERLQNEFNQLLNNEEDTISVEYRYKCKDSTYKWVKLTATNRVNDPAIGGVLLNYHDISPRKQAEEEQSKSENKLLDAQRIARLGHYVLDVRTGNWSSSAELDKIFGTDSHFKKNVSGWVDIIHPDHKDSLLKYLQEKILKEHQRFDREYKIINLKSGQVKWVHGLGDLKFDENNNPIEMFGTIQDITERRKTEDALKQSEDKFKTIFESSPLSTVLSDLEGNILQFNRAFTELHAINTGSEDFKGRNVAEFFLQDDLPLLMSEIQTTIQEGKSHGATEYTMLKDDGTPFTAEASSTLITDHNGTPTAILGIANDITERKRAENKILELKEFNEAIVSNVAEGIIAEDNEGTIQFANPTMLKMLGYKKEELVGKHWKTFVPDDQVEIVEKANRRRRERVSDQYEMELLRKDGSRIYVLVGGVPDVQDNEYIGLLAAFTDITDRKRSEEALRESETKFRSVIEQSNDAIYILCNDTFDLVNRRFVELTGASRKEMKAQNFDFMKFIAEEDRPLIEERVKMRERGEQPPSVYEFSLINREGLRRRVQASVTEIDYKDKTAILGILRDITEQKELEEQLRQAQKIESIGHLAGGISHDFNNLLTPIIVNAELALMNLEPSDPLHEDIHDILETGKRAADLTRQLLAFSRKQILEVQTTDLNRLIADFRKILRRTIREDIKIEVKYGASIGNVRVDISQIEQILLNLLVNAQDAMPDGGLIKIKTELVDHNQKIGDSHRDMKSGEYVSLSVSDNGEGMDAETASKIFDPFFTTKDVDKGTGLGLSTVYGIVKQHGGNILVNSKPGEGTTFEIYLPTVEAELVSEDEQEADKKKFSGTENILIVEDQEQVRNIAMRILKSYGYIVSVAGDAEEALYLVNEIKLAVDLLLVDVILPGMNGRDLAEHLCNSLPGLKVLFMSGYTTNVLAPHGIMEEGIEFLRKPLRVEALVEKVRSMCPAPVEIGILGS